MLYFFFTIDAKFQQLKMFIFDNVQTTNFTFVGKKRDNSINSYSIAQFQIVSDTKYDIWYGFEDPELVQYKSFEMYWETYMGSSLYVNGEAQKRGI